MIGNGPNPPRVRASLESRLDGVLALLVSFIRDPSRATARKGLDGSATLLRQIDAAQHRLFVATVRWTVFVLAVALVAESALQRSLILGYTILLVSFVLVRSRAIYRWTVCYIAFAIAHDEMQQAAAALASSAQAATSPGDPASLAWLPYGVATASVVAVEIGMVAWPSAQLLMRVPWPPLVVGWARRAWSAGVGGVAGATIATVLATLLPPGLLAVSGATSPSVPGQLAIFGGAIGLVGGFIREDVLSGRRGAHPQGRSRTGS